MLPLGFVIFPYLIILISNLSNQKSFFTFFFNGFLFGLGFLTIYLYMTNPNPKKIDKKTGNSKAKKAYPSVAS
jgi:hypothetical protein